MCTRSHNAGRLEGKACQWSSCYQLNIAREDLEEETCEQGQRCDMPAGAKSEISSTYFAAVAAAVVSSTLKSYAGMGSSSSPLKPNDTDRTAGNFDELSLLEPNAERSCSPLYDCMEATYLPRAMP
jgi:hypothetical protein